MRVALIETSHWRFRQTEEDTITWLHRASPIFRLLASIPDSLSYPGRVVVERVLSKRREQAVVGYVPATG